jgi:hypothetical protein
MVLTLSFIGEVQEGQGHTAMPMQQAPAPNASLNFLLGTLLMDGTPALCSAHVWLFQVEDGICTRVCHVTCSLTKFISGASDIIAGAVCGSTSFITSLTDFHMGGWVGAGGSDHQGSHILESCLPAHICTLALY